MLATPSAVVFLNNRRQSRISCDHNWLVFLSLLHLLLQCFIPHVRSTRTCPNGRRGRWQLWKAVSVYSLSLSVATHSSVVVVFLIRQLEFYLTKRSFILFFERYGGLIFRCAPSTLAVFVEASVFNQNVSTWNTGAVINMGYSKWSLSSAASLSIWPPQCSHSVVLFCILKRYLVCCWAFFSLLHSLLQCFNPHLRSIRTCPNGRRARWQLWTAVSALSPSLCGHAFRCCDFE